MMVGGLNPVIPLFREHSHMNLKSYRAHGWSIRCIREFRILSLQKKKNETSIVEINSIPFYKFDRFSDRLVRSDRVAFRTRVFTRLEYILNIWFQKYLILHSEYFLKLSKQYLGSFSVFIFFNNTIISKLLKIWIFYYIINSKYRMCKFLMQKLTMIANTIEKKYILVKYSKYYSFIIQNTCGIPFEKINRIHILSTIFWIFISNTF